MTSILFAFVLKYRGTIKFLKFLILLDQEGSKGVWFASAVDPLGSEGRAEFIFSCVLQWNVLTSYLSKPLTILPFGKKSIFFYSFSQVSITNIHELCVMRKRLLSFQFQVLQVSKCLSDYDKNQHLTRVCCFWRNSQPNLKIFKLWLKTVLEILL